ncbi:MAG: hypothetical protein ACJAZO_001503 [Myxococcota bacterium]|jgi:hypothetical protein
MHRFILSIAGLSVATAVMAVPLEITHQGRLLNSAGDPLNGEHLVGVSLLGAPPSSSVLWTEDFTVAVADGYFSLRLGSTEENPLDSTWFEEQVWVRTSLGGLTTSEQALSSVPFSVQSFSVTGGIADVSEVRVGNQIALVGPGETVCDETTRGAMHFVLGNGTDTADYFEGCVSDLEGGHTWTPIGDTVNNELYPFVTHTFSTCGSTGQTGPTLDSCRSAYTTDWDETDSFNMDVDGIQLWTVPQTGLYRVVAQGAGGGRSSSSIAQALGAEVAATLQLTAGDVLQLLVGQRGRSNATHGNESGGSGGTFIVTANDVPLVVAGGAGGAPSSTYGTSCTRTIATGHGRAESNGNPSICGSYSALGGTNGSGGQTAGGPQQGAAGGGFATAGQVGVQHCAPAPVGGSAFIDGGIGGSGAGSCYSPKPNGGFGGGGAGGLGSPGGGGGYSGGAAAGQWSSYSNYGGGGGSYAVATATDVVIVAGTNAGEGSVSIVQL